MRATALLGIIAAALWVTQALAQSDNGNAIAVPPAPPIVASPPAAPAAPTPPAAPSPPGLVETPLPPPVTPDNTDTGTANGNTDTTDSTSAAPSVPAPAPPPAVQSDWVSGKTAEIRVLDKVDGSIADLTIPVGGQSLSGDLQVSVLACDVHPPGQLPDDAIFVSIQPSADPAAPPVYRGWMVRSVPAASVVGDASETFRVVSCN